MCIFEKSEIDLKLIYLCQVFQIDLHFECKNQAEKSDLSSVILIKIVLLENNTFPEYNYFC